MSEPIPTPQSIARRIFKKLDADIRDRQGLKHEWNAISDTVMKSELRPAWESIFIDELTSALQREAGLRDILKQIMFDLPMKRDWLDPSLEHRAKEALKSKEAQP